MRTLPKSLAIDLALRRFADRDANAAECFAGLFAEIRPRDPDDAATARANYALMLDTLAANPGHRAAIWSRFAEFFARRKQIGFFTDAGILPNTGFFTELGTRLVERVLPEVPDPWQLKDALGMIFDDRRDRRWLDAIPAEMSERFWSLLQPPPELAAEAAQPILATMVDALLVLSHRVSAMGLEPALVRLEPALLERESPFLAQSVEAVRFADSYRAALAAGGPPREDERHLLVLLDQCRGVLRQVRKTALRLGTSLELTYLLRRCWQSLERMEALADLLAARYSADVRAAAVARWALLVRAAARGESERRSIRLLFARLGSTLALRVTDNAAQTGEHYVAHSRADYAAMWRSAMGAGVVIAFLALLKIYASKLGWPPLNQAFVYSMIYALGFVLIYLLHFTIATKQPAMTAQTLAAAIGEMDAARGDLRKLVDLVAGVARTQLAAILGNVLVAFPVALCIAGGLWTAKGAPFIDAAKAHHLLHELDPLRSLAIPHAAVAGVCLFLTGLISGYFDNLAAHGRIAERVARLRWLRTAAGPERAAAAGEYMRRNLGGIAGNFLFGVMLGSIGTLAGLFGLPIDIRHIAFASANLAYALVALDFEVPLRIVLWSTAGVALIGLTNLAVSFSLALWVALKARGVAFGRTRELVALLAKEVRARPSRFLFPPPAGAAPEPQAHARG